LTDDETAEVASFTKAAMRALTDASGAHGFNIGMNQGSVAGAGIAAHLHQHVVRGGAVTPTSCDRRAHQGAAAVAGDTRQLLAAAWPS